MKSFAARVSRAPSAPKKKRPPAPPGAMKKFVEGLILAVLVGVIGLIAAYRIFGWGGPPPPGDPAALTQSARDAIDAVAKRDLSATMKPAKYDDIMRPLDQMLREASARLHADDYDPIADYEFIRARTEPVPQIADDAYRLAMSETTFLKKEFRFMEQKGDACRYWASALWSRLEAAHDQARPEERFAPTVAESDQLMRIITTGLDAAAENPFLWHLRGTAERAGGAFASAAESFGKAVQLDPQFTAAWNDLGLVRINLKDFPGAEEALTKAKDLAERSWKASAKDGAPGDSADYAAAVMNLADFHDALATYYDREAEVDPSEENDREARRHATAAETYASEARMFGDYELPSKAMFR